MIAALGDALAWIHGFADPLVWIVLAAFLVGALLERAAARPTIEWADERLVRRAYLGAWLALAAYWLTQIHYFVFQARSIVEAPAVIAAVPISVYVGVLIVRGRDQLVVLSRAIAVMWLIYMPFTSLAVLRRPLIETVTYHSEFVLRLLTQDFRVITGVVTEAGIRTGPPITMNGTELGANLSIGEKHYPYRSTFLFVQDGHPIMYTIRIACTGIGSMAVFAGLIAAVRAPLRRKLKAIATAAGIIYVLNIARNVFISYTFGEQRLHVFPDLILGLFGLDDPYLVSYYVSDRIISQSLSVVILIGITWIVVRQVPEVLAIVEEGLAVLTGREVDLSEVIDSRREALDGESVAADASESGEANGRATDESGDQTDG